MAVGAILGQRGIQSVNGVQSGVDGNIDLSAGTMTSGIDMNNQTLTGLTTPANNTDAVTKQYTDTAVQNAAPYNWLDNSDFTNLVAQAGIGGNHGSQAYAADRWILNSGSVSYNAGTGLTLNGTITQKLEFLPTGTTSVFVGMASGSANISYSAGTVTITSSGGVIAWAALYEGTYTQENIPDYRPKGYVNEMRICQYYYYKASFLYQQTVGFCYYGQSWLNCELSLPSSMRLTNPTIRQTGTIALIGASGSFNTSTPTGSKVTGTVVQIGYSGTATIQGAGYYYFNNSAGERGFELIADL